MRRRDRQNFEKGAQYQSKQPKKPSGLPSSTPPPKGCADVVAVGRQDTWPKIARSKRERVVINPKDLPAFVLK